MGRRIFLVEELKSVVEGGHVVATDLNSRGDIIGADVSDWSANNRGRYFLRIEGDTQFPAPFAEGWEAYSLNDHRDAAGFFGRGGTHEGGDFVRRAAVVPGNGRPGIDVHALLQRDQPVWSQCVEVNNVHQVCGFYSLDGSIGDDTSEKGFLFNFETDELIFLADRGLSSPTGLSDTQRVVGRRSGEGARGYAHDLLTSTTQALSFFPQAVSKNGQWIIGRNQNSFAVLWQQGEELVELNGLGGDSHQVSDVNNLGLAVGHATPPAVNGQPVLPRAVLYDGGTAYDLNQLVRGTDWSLVLASKINDDGVILAKGVRPEHLNNLSLALTRLETVVLRPLPAIERDAPYLGFEQLFGGAAVGGPGVGLIGGKLRPIPPWDPEVWQTVWDTLNPAQRDVLAALGLSRYAEQLTDPQARQSLAELSQKLIVDSASKLVATNKSPRLKLDTRSLLPLAKKQTVSGQRSDEGVWKAVEKLLSRHLGSSFSEKK